MEVQVLSWAVIEKLEEHSRQIMFVLKFDNLNLEFVSDLVLRISDFFLLRSRYIRAVFSADS